MKCQRLFRGEGDDCIRIPTIVAAPDGTVYAFANVRVSTSRDNAAETHLMVAVKRPGCDWEEAKTVASRKDWSYMIGSAVCDSVTGKVMCFFKKIAVVLHEFKKEMGPEERNRLAAIKEERDGDKEGDYVLETTDGITFTQRKIEIKPMAGGASGFLLGKGGSPHGSGSGVTLQYGPHKGRIVVPARVSLKECVTWEDLKTGSSNTVIYSDDRGESFVTGGIVEPGTGEGTLAERSDGSIYYNSRAYFNDGLRRGAVSYDGGESFVEQSIHQDLIEPCCNAAVLRVEWQGKTIFFFSNPRSTTDRVDMSVYYSLDEGATWTYGVTIDHRKAAYSSMCYDAKSEKVFLLFECGTETSVDQIDIVEFTPDEILGQ